MSFKAIRENKILAKISDFTCAKTSLVHVGVHKFKLTLPTNVV